MAMQLAILKTGVLWLSIVGLNEWLSQAAEYLIDTPIPARVRVLMDGLLLGLAAGRILKLRS
jgi:hypothetical protein